LYVLQRRDSFRATLRKDLKCQVFLESRGKAGDQSKERVGQLRDLSMGGCSVELPLAAVRQVAGLGDAFQLTLVFPNGRRLSMSGTLRRVVPQVERQSLTAGFSFIEPTSEQSR